jgi:hypothetical protein
LPDATFNRRIIFWRPNRERPRISAAFV